MDKDYLGDSVYVEHDGYHLVLTTENGYGPSNRICLDPDVYAALVGYHDRLVARASTPNGDGKAVES
jgi:hypothetical protein